MYFPFQQIDSTMHFLADEAATGWKLGKRGGCLAPGTIISGRYRIEEILDWDGTRGLYAVTRVHCEGVCHFCGLKIEETHSPFCPHCGARLRGNIFQMEVFLGPIELKMIRRLLEISHPGIAQIYDAFSTGSLTYVVSEYTSGVTLDRLEGMLTAQQIRTLGICLAQIVGFLHSQGIYRVNLQPGNLKMKGRSPRLISLSTCRLKGSMAEKDLDRCDREDFRGLLETLEKLAAEYVNQDQDEMLCRLLVALEEMIGRDKLSAGEIQEELALL